MEYTNNLEQLEALELLNCPPLPSDSYLTRNLTNERHLKKRGRKKLLQMSTETDDLHITGKIIQGLVNPEYDREEGQHKHIGCDACDTNWSDVWDEEDQIFLRHFSEGDHNVRNVRNYTESNHASYGRPNECYELKSKIENRRVKGHDDSEWFGKTTTGELNDFLKNMEESGDYSRLDSRLYKNGRNGYQILGLRILYDDEVEDFDWKREELAEEAAEADLRYRDTSTILKKLKARYECFREDSATKEEVLETESGQAPLEFEERYGIQDIAVAIPKPWKKVENKHRYSGHKDEVWGSKDCCEIGPIDYRTAKRFDQEIDL